MWYCCVTEPLEIVKHNRQKMCRSYIESTLVEGLRRARVGRSLHSTEYLFNTSVTTVSRQISRSQSPTTQHTTMFVAMRDAWCQIQSRVDW